MAARAVGAARPAWLGPNEWAGRLDGASRAADMQELLGRRWWLVPGPDLDPGALDDLSLVWWAAHQAERRN